MKRKQASTKKAARKFYSDLPPEELERMAAPFEREMVTTRPLTQAMRAQERRAKRKRGRPVVGEGAAKVLITLERGLLREADSYARKHHFRNRSQLIAQTLRSLMDRDGLRRAS